MSEIRLPKQIEPACADRLVAAFRASERQLWDRGSLAVPEARLTARVREALASARAASRLLRGFEAAERALDAEARGQRRVDRKTGVARGGRVSRLLLLADDGSERFYRNAESLLLRHEPRVLAMRFAADQNELGELCFGPGHVARALLVEHKDAVADVLVAMDEDRDVA